MDSVSLSESHSALKNVVGAFFDNEDAVVFQSVIDSYVQVETNVVPRLKTHLVSIRKQLADLGNCRVTGFLPEALLSHCGVVSLIDICERKLLSIVRDRQNLTDLFALWETAPRNKKYDVLQKLLDLSNVISRDISVHSLNNTVFTETDFLKLVSPTSVSIMEPFHLDTHVIDLDNVASAVSAYGNVIDRIVRLDPAKQDSVDFLEAAADVLEILARKQLIAVYSLRTVMKYLTDSTRS